MDDRELIRNLLDPATREAAYRELVQSYQRPLYFHIRDMVKDHQDADDVLQNTFIKVFRSLSGFKNESRLYTWIYRIATNEALSFISARDKRQNRIATGESEEKAGSLYAGTDIDADDIQLRLQKAIDSLPQKQQLVFRMKYYKEMKYDDMSEILDTSVGALKASYFHAVKKIEQYMNAG